MWLVGNEAWPCWVSCADAWATAALQVLPHNGEPMTVTMYSVAMVTCGLLKSWAAPACNNPIFAEIVPAHLRTLVYSFDRQATSSPN